MKDYVLDKTIMLNMNKNPAVRSYLHHATVNAIISGSIEDSSDVSMKLDFCEEDNHSWSKNEHIIVSHEKIVMKEEGSSNYEYIYRDCNEVDEITVYIDILKNKNANSVLNFVVTSGDYENNIRNNSKTYKFGIMDGHVITRLEEPFYLHTKFEDDKYKYVKLYRNKKQVSGYISENGEDWILIEELTADFLDNECKIGIIAEEIRTDDLKDEYDKWLCMNYIQMFLNPDDLGKVYIDYSMFPIKGCSYEYAYSSNFLDIDYIEIDDVIDVFGNVLSFINWCLKRGYYAAVTMDEYYIHGRRAYLREHFFHHNVVYGYNADLQTYNLMSYHTFLNNDEISIEEIEKSLHKSQGIIMLYKIKKSGRDYNLSLKYMIHQFENLLYGRNSNESNYSIIQQKGIYGLDVIKELCESEYGRSLVLEDYRTTYFLYEHCFLMKKRLEYLKKEFIDLHLDELDEKCSLMVNISETIKNLVLKNLITKLVLNKQVKKHHEERAITLLNELYEKEVDFYTALIKKMKGI